MRIGLRKSMAVLLILALLVSLCAFTGISALADDSELSLVYDLTVTGSTGTYDNSETTSSLNVCRVAQGDTITVSFKIHRTDKDEAYTLYSLQNEIMFDKDFFSVDAVSVHPEGNYTEAERQTRTGGVPIIKSSMLNNSLLRQFAASDELVCTFQMTVLGSTKGNVWCSDTGALDAANKIVSKANLTEKNLLVVVGNTPANVTEVTFDPAPGTMDPFPTDYSTGDKITLPGVHTREGFDFLGWVSEGVTYPAGGEFTVEKNTAFTARWGRITRVTLDLNGGSAAEGTPLTYDSAVSRVLALPTTGLTNPGYRFDGWGTAADAAAAVDNPYTVPENDTGAISLYAIWTPNTPNVTYRLGTEDARWSDADPSGSVSAVVNLPAVGAAIRDGYTLTGWSYQGSVYVPAATCPAAATDMIFVAQWVRNGTVSFQVSIPNAPATAAAPSPAAVADISAEPGSPIQLPTLSHLSYRFHGWSTSPQRDNPITGQYVMPQTGVTLYAVWGPCEHYYEALRTTTTVNDTHIENTSTHRHIETRVTVCQDCGAVVSTTETVNRVDTCTAASQVNWTSNATQHWHICSVCGGACDNENHIYTDANDETCNVCNYRRTVVTSAPSNTGTESGSEGGTITRINGGTTPTVINNPSGGTTTIVDDEVPLASIDNLILVTVLDPSSDITATGARNTDGSITIVAKDANGITQSHVPGGLLAEIHGVTTGQVVVIIDPATGEILDLVEKSLVEGQVAYTLLDGSVTIRIIDNAKPFDDVMPYDWFNDSVIFASSHELFNGTAERIFEPNTPMSRGMLVTVLWRLENKPDDFSENVFSDVENETWYTDPVRWATKNGIVKGYDDGTFRPNKEITREEMAAILYRYMNYLQYNVTGRNDLSAYTDASSVAQWALENVQWAVDAGIITGVTADTIQPQTTATRAQVATMFQRIVTGMVK